MGLGFAWYPAENIREELDSGQLKPLPLRDGADRYGSGVKSSGERDKLVPEGVEARIPYRGSLAYSVHQLLGGLRAGMGYCGCKNIESLRTESKFIKVTSSGLRESHVHDVIVTKEAPNYNIE